MTVKYHYEKFPPDIKIDAEFEAIHPFLDGNGRIGRMIIPLYLWKKGLLNAPSFYISEYFEQNKQHYYDGLLAVSANNDWLNWCKFFMTAIEQQAKENLQRATAIIDYYEQLKIKMPEMTKSAHGITALDFIFKTTYFNSTSFCKKTCIPEATAKRLLRVFENNDLLTCIKGAGRIPNFYIFKKLIDIADGK